MTYAMRHARLRALQRLPGVCPGEVVRGAAWAIKCNRQDLLEFVEWRGPDKGIWRGVTANEQRFRVVANPCKGVVITVLEGW